MANNAIAKSDAFTSEEVELIKTQIAPGCSDNELKLFMHVAKSRGLDPFARQIYAIRRKQYDQESRAYVMKMTIQTGIDGFRLIAKRSGNEAIGDPEFEYSAAAKSATNPLGLVRATVQVWPKGATRPTPGSAYWDEYRQLKSDGGLANMWATMPRTMLGKCAEAIALRRAYPEELSGLYAAEELDQADNPAPTIANVIAPTAPAPQLAAAPANTQPADPMPQILNSLRTAASVEEIDRRAKAWSKTIKSLSDEDRDAAGALYKARREELSTPAPVEDDPTEAAEREAIAEASP